MVVGRLVFLDPPCIRSAGLLVANFTLVSEFLESVRQLLVAERDFLVVEHLFVQVDDLARGDVMLVSFSQKSQNKVVAHPPRSAGTIIHATITKVDLHK